MARTPRQTPVGRFAPSRDSAPPPTSFNAQVEGDHLSGLAQQFAKATPEGRLQDRYPAADATDQPSPAQIAIYEQSRLLAAFQAEYARDPVRNDAAGPEDREFWVAWRQIADDADSAVRTSSTFAKADRWTPAERMVLRQARLLEEFWKAAGRDPEASEVLADDDDREFWKAYKQILDEEMLEV